MASTAEEIYNRMAGIKPTAAAAGPPRTVNGATVSVPVPVSASVSVSAAAAVAAPDGSSDGTEEALDESRCPLDESGATHNDSSEDEVEDAVAEDILKFEQSFKNITQRYRLINRIGEGEGIVVAY